jgi:alpha-beta hydrolase superfamily lysophospholipase
MPPSTEFRLTSTDGLRIACVRWDGRGSVRGVVQIAHGIGDNLVRLHS